MILFKSRERKKGKGIPKITLNRSCTKKDRIQNDEIHLKIGVAYIDENMRKSGLR
jgi:hypothetical protein